MKNTNLHLIVLGIVGCFYAAQVSAYTFVNWDANMTSGVLSNIAALMSDLSPLLIIVIPILLVGLIIGLILSRIGGNK